MLSRLLVLFIGFWISLGLSASEKVEPVYYFQADLRYEYEVELLQLALDLTQKEYGAAKATPKIYPTHLRGIFAMTRGQIDVAFLGTSTRYEEDYLPIRVPILQGMLGYRVLLTTEARKDKIDALRTLEDLQENAVAAFGVHWEDARILRHNQLLTSEHASYEEIFRSLHRGETDYIPRGINEVFRELKAQQKLSKNIVLSEKAVLFYPHLRYFFVTRYNRKLAERLEKGLQLALENGSFKALFDKHYRHIKPALEGFRPHIIRIENPYQPQLHPMVRTDWWLPDSQATRVSYSQ